MTKLFASYYHLCDSVPLNVCNHRYVEVNCIISVYVIIMLLDEKTKYNQLAKM